MVVTKDFGEHQSIIKGTIVSVQSILLVSVLSPATVGLITVQ
jgi:hypothetical protein